MYLLDTDTLTHLYFGNSNVVNRLTSLEDLVIGTTIITKAEILRGRIDYMIKAETGEGLLKAQELFFRTEEFLSDLLIVPINQPVSAEFDRLRAISKLRKIGRTNLLIASVAIANRATLVTRNLRHFKQVPGLSIENWVD
jgi:tRNA(fMet)-specific endonuclease VapC